MRPEDADDLELALAVRGRHGVDVGARGPVCARCVADWPCELFLLAQAGIREVFAALGDRHGYADAPAATQWALLRHHRRAHADPYRHAHWFVRAADLGLDRATTARDLTSAGV